MFRVGSGPGGPWYRAYSGGGGLRVPGWGGARGPHRVWTGLRVPVAAISAGRDCPPPRVPGRVSGRERFSLRRLMPWPASAGSQAAGRPRGRGSARAAPRTRFRPGGPADEVPPGQPRGRGSARAAPRTRFRPGSPADEVPPGQPRGRGSAWAAPRTRFRLGSPADEVPPGQPRGRGSAWAAELSRDRRTSGRAARTSAGPRRAAGPGSSSSGARRPPGGRAPART